MKMEMEEDDDDDDDDEEDEDDEWVWSCTCYANIFSKVASKGSTTQTASFILYLVHIQLISYFKYYIM